ncbi:hypothetical protein Tco_0238919, partial [Tanacetum coccineum]
NFGALNQFITYRDLYDARLNVNMTVKELLVNGVWKWPDGWIERFPILLQIQNVTLDEQKRDEMNFPKQAFIPWLAVQNKLSTQDTIRLWGSHDVIVTEKLDMGRMTMDWVDMLDTFA